MTGITDAVRKRLDEAAWEAVKERHSERRLCDHDFLFVFAVIPAADVELVRTSLGTVVACVPREGTQAFGAVKHMQNHGMACVIETYGSEDGLRECYHLGVVLLSGYPVETAQRSCFRCEYSSRLTMTWHGEFLLDDDASLPEIYDPNDDDDRNPVVWAEVERLSYRRHWPVSVE
jgi:hypothetical protein